MALWRAAGWLADGQWLVLAGRPAAHSEPMGLGTWGEGGLSIFLWGATAAINLCSIHQELHLTEDTIFFAHLMVAGS
jgi:hypothetical protein